MLRFNLDSSALFSPFLSEFGWILCIDLVVQHHGCNCSAPLGWALKISTFSTYWSTRTLAALHLLEKKKKELPVTPVINYFLRIKAGRGSNGCDQRWLWIQLWQMPLLKSASAKNFQPVDEKVKNQEAEL